MGAVELFEDLEVWEDARQLRIEIRQLVDSTTIRKDFSLADQIKRSSLSTMGNIAEVSKRTPMQILSSFFTSSKVLTEKHARTFMRFMMTNTLMNKHCLSA